MISTCALFPNPKLPSMTETSNTLERQQLQKCVALLNRLKRNANAGPFLKPVDPVALGIPDYFEKIKYPMDLSTVKQSLSAGKYSTLEEFDKDIQLMFSNCFTYNAPGTPVYEMGKNLSISYKGLLQQLRESPSQAPVRAAPKIQREVHQQKLTAEELNICTDIINGLTKIKHRKYNWPFLAPVTEEEAPGYFSIIAQPMDLSTIRGKLDSAAYQNVTDFISDVLLIFNNCRVYNPEGTEVYYCGEELEKVAKSLIIRPFGAELKVVEQREKLQLLQGELEELEEKMRTETGEVVYGQETRRSLGDVIMRLTKEQVDRVAEIVYKNRAYGYLDGEELEVNLCTLPDSVMNEISEFIKGNVSG